VGPSSFCFVDSCRCWRRIQNGKQPTVSVYGGRAHDGQARRDLQSKTKDDPPKNHRNAAKRQSCSTSRGLTRNSYSESSRTGLDLFAHLLGRVPIGGEEFEPLSDGQPLVLFPSGRDKKVIPWCPTSLRSSTYPNSNKNHRQSLSNS